MTDEEALRYEVRVMESRIERLTTERDEARAVYAEVARLRAENAALDEALNDIVHSISDARAILHAEGNDKSTDGPLTDAILKARFAQSGLRALLAGDAQPQSHALAAEQAVIDALKADPTLAEKVGEIYGGLPQGKGTASDE